MYPRQRPSPRWGSSSDVVMGAQITLHLVHQLANDIALTTPTAFKALAQIRFPATSCCSFATRSLATAAAVTVLQKLMRLKELLFLLEFNATASVTGRVTSSIRTNATARFATRQREMWDQAFYICSVHVLTNHHNRPASSKSIH